MPGGWTHAKLETALRQALLARTSVRLAELPHDRSADVEWTPQGRTRVRVDHFDVGIRPGVLHELLHTVLDRELSNFDKKLSEKIIETFEDEMNARILQSKRRLAWWRREIERRLTPREPSAGSLPASAGRGSGGS